MTKIKCIKCGLRFKDRNDQEDVGAVKDLCFNCRFVWKTLRIYLTSIGLMEKVNRDVVLNLNDVIIRKKKSHV